MSNTVEVRVTRAQYRHNRQQYSQGDVLEVSEETLEKHPRSLERVEDDNADAETEGEAEAEPDGDGDEDAVTPLSEDELDPHPSDLTVDEIRERVENADLPTLYGIRDAEKAAENRSTAIEAIEAQIDDVEG